MNVPAEGGTQGALISLGSAHEATARPGWPPTNYADFMAGLHPGYQTPGAEKFCPKCGAEAVVLDRVGNWLQLLACPVCDADEIRGRS